MDNQKEGFNIEKEKEKEKEINNNKDNNNEEDKRTSLEEAIPREVRIANEIPKNEENINNNNKKKSLINEEDSDPKIPIGKKVMETILLNLNVYWLELLGILTLISSLIIYESIGIILLYLILMIFQGEFEISDITNALSVIVNNIGLKWLMFIIISQHLSIGFFCLTTFSYTFREIVNIKKFFILNIIKFVLYYVFCIGILKFIIRDYIAELLITKIQETKIMKKERTLEIINPLVDKVVTFAAGFLSSFNIFLEKLVLGSIYIFLFYEIKTISKGKILVFRLLSLIPISFMIISLIIRALENRNKVKLNEYVSSFLLGPKISIYGFFITTIVEIKYKSIEYDVFDSDNYIDPRVFTKIGSKNYGIFGIIELLVGFFFPNWINIGIGKNYLMVLCAPIVAIYDYKRSSKRPFPCCKKGNFSLFFKIIVYLLGFLIVIILGFYLIILLVGFITNYISPLIEFIIDNFDIIKDLLRAFLN